MATRKESSRSRNASKKAPQRKSHRKKKPAGLVWLVVALVIVAGGIWLALQIKDLYEEVIFEGITVDGIDVAGMTEDQAFATARKAADERLENISIIFRYNDKTWSFNAEDLEAQINVKDAVATAYETGKSGGVIERFKVAQETKTAGLAIKSSFVVDKLVLVDALEDVKKEIDQPMIEPKIEFDATGIGYDEFNDPEFDEVAAMFTITPGSVGYAMDYDKALQDLNDQISEGGWNADIMLAVKESYPTKSLEELEECTTLIYHASSPITSSNRKIPNRNSNIKKAIGFYKGMVVLPGQIVSYNEVLGQRTEQAGWLPAPIIARDKSVKDEIGGGICQAATTIFNAAFRAGAKILQNNPHSWRAYYDPFGYGMDAMINYGTSDMIFENTSEYPMFINTYLWYSPSTGVPGYVDVDIYTMPQKDEQGNILHIMPEAIEIRTEAAPPMEYQEIDEAKAAADFPDAEWTIDPALGKYTYLHIKPRALYEYEVYRVWYKNCAETEDKGVWAPGEEVKREYAHTYLYDSVAGLTYTKPTPTPAPTATPAPPTPSPSESATG